MNPLEIEFLGTGTSQGVPVIGCDCEICQSKNLKNKRLRSSVLIKSGNSYVVIDCGPDFRQQMLRSKCQRLNAVVLTHEHMDHISGLDDVRPFNFKTKLDMPVYCTKRVENRLKEQFSYAFSAEKYPGSPGFEIININSNENFKIGNQRWTPILAQHGTWPVTGFRIQDFVYMTDISGISKLESQKILGSKVLVINALRKSKHVSHFSLDEAISYAKSTKVPEVYLTHASHQLGLHEEVSDSLPKGYYLAYDGLKIIIQ